MSGVGPLTRLRRVLGDGASDSRFLLGKGVLDLVARVLGVALVLGWSMVLTRTMGPTDYGHYVYAMSAVFFTCLVGGLGMPVATAFYIQRYARMRGGRMSGYMTTAIVVSILGPTLATLGLWTAVHLWGGRMFDAFSLATVLFYGVGFAVLNLLTYANRALEESTLAAFCEQVWPRVASLVVLGGILLVGMPLSPELALAVYALGAWVVLLPLFRTIRRKALAGRPRGRMREVKRLFPIWMRRSSIMMITPLFFIVLSETDVLMLGAVTTPALVAIYHVARRVASLMRFVQLAVVGVGMHRFARAHMDRDLARTQGLLDSMTLIGLIPAAIGWIIFLLVGPFLLGLFGPEMKAGYLALMLLATAGVYDIAMGPATELLMMSGQEKIVGMVNIGAGVLNVLLNLSLIPWLHLEGAALATLSCVVLWKSTLAWVAWKRLGVITPIVLRLPVFLGRGVKIEG